MRYTPEQYNNMSSHVTESILDAELHNGRILKRLEHETERIALHQKLHTLIHQCLEVCSDIEDRIDHGTS